MHSFPVNNGGPVPKYFSHSLLQVEDPPSWAHKRCHGPYTAHVSAGRIEAPNVFECSHVECPSTQSRNTTSPQLTFGSYRICVPYSRDCSATFSMIRPPSSQEVNRGRPCPSPLLSNWRSIGISRMHLTLPLEIEIEACGDFRRRSHVGPPEPAYA